MRIHWFVLCFLTECRQWKIQNITKNIHKNLTPFHSITFTKGEDAHYFLNI